MAIVMMTAFIGMILTACPTDSSDDDEPSPTEVSGFSAVPTSIVEGGDESTVTLTLNRAIPAGDPALTFPYTITGIDAGDITASSLTGSIMVAAGSDSGTATIAAMQDAEDESAGETMAVTLGTLPDNADSTAITLASGVSGSLTITITDEEPDTATEEPDTARYRVTFDANWSQANNGGTASPSVHTFPH